MIFDTHIGQPFDADGAADARNLAREAVNNRVIAEKKVQKLNEEIQLLRSEIHSANEARVEDRRRRRDAVAQDEASERIAILEKSNAQLKSKLAAADSTIEALRQECSKAAQENARAEAHSATLEANIIEKDKRCEGLLRELDDSAATIRGLKTKANSLRRICPKFSAHWE